MGQYHVGGNYRSRNDDATDGGGSQEGEGDGCDGVAMMIIMTVVMTVSRIIISLRKSLNVFKLIFVIILIVCKLYNSNSFSLNLTSCYIHDQSFERHGWFE